MGVPLLLPTIAGSAVPDGARKSPLRTDGTNKIRRRVYLLRCQLVVCFARPSRPAKVIVVGESTETCIPAHPRAHAHTLLDPRSHTRQFPLLSCRVNVSHGIASIHCAEVGGAGELLRTQRFNPQHPRLLETGFVGVSFTCGLTLQESFAHSPAESQQLVLPNVWPPSAANVLVNMSGNTSLSCLGPSRLDPPTCLLCNLFLSLVPPLPNSQLPVLTLLGCTH